MYAVLTLLYLYILGQLDLLPVVSLAVDLEKNAIKQTT